LYLSPPEEKVSGSLLPGSLPEKPERNNQDPTKKIRSLPVLIPDDRFRDQLLQR
jgi:hypothetical protein